MLQTAEYSVGWMESSVQHFVEKIDPLPSSMKFTLITCLDSSFEVSSMLKTSSLLAPLKPEAKVVGKGVMVPTKKLLAAQAAECIFHGFDELWFFPTASLTAKPKQASIVGPERVPADLPAQLVRWMKENSCSLGLGDGVGLNFVARLKGVPRLLVNQLSESNCVN